LSTSTPSLDLVESLSETSGHGTSAAAPLIFSTQARASALLPLPGARHERARVREGPAFWGDAAIYPGSHTIS
jgi:hypothetical protein